MCEFMSFMQIWLQMNYRLYIIYYRVSLEKEYRMMYRIGICDDEEACRIKISESIRNIALKNDVIWRKECK